MTQTEEQERQRLGEGMLREGIEALVAVEPPPTSRWDEKTLVMAMRLACGHFEVSDLLKVNCWPLEIRREFLVLAADLIKRSREVVTTPAPAGERGAGDE